jgi:uncharacterized membrane protein
MTTPATRRTYLDVLRGVTVLVMIEAHVIDSWTRAGDRATNGFREALIVGGFAAPLFLFLAGVAVAMSAGSKARRGGDDRAAAIAAGKRGLQIFALAFVFRLQSYLLSRAPAWSMLKVDILNVMGPSMIAAAVLWWLLRNPRGRIVGFLAAMVAFVLATPVIRHLAGLDALPDPIEGYLRPIPGLTNFTFFPWVGFVMAGAALGVILDAARDATADRRANLACLGIGLATAAIAYKASFLPPLHPRSGFWTTSASFFFIRLGLMVAAVGAAWLWEKRPSLRLRSGQTAGRWSPLQMLGRSSLFVYWVHVELVYGLISLPLHGAFSLQAAWVGYVLVCALMTWLTYLKDRVKRNYLSKHDLRGKLSSQAQPLMF